MSVVKSLLATSLAFGFISLAGCSSDDGDTTPPVLSNLSHTDNQKVIGDRTIGFSVDVTDETAVTSVVITHNDVSQTVTNTSGTYSVTITLEDRTNNVIVVTANDAENTSSQTITLNYPFLALTNGQAASVVIGQPDFDSTSINQGGMPAANTLNGPYGVKVVNNRLYVADKENNRVLGFNSIPTTNNASADFVIGQNSFTTDTSGYTDSELIDPRGIASNGNDFLISHSSFGRIHYWSSVPTSNVSAEIVIGKPGFVSGSGFICAGDVFYLGVNSISIVNGKLIAADSSGNRILIWNSMPTVNGQAADLVLGQQSFINCAANDTNDDGFSDNATASTFNSTRSLWTDGVRLVVADSLNHRVLIWNTFPISNFQPADIVLGQPDFTTINTPASHPIGAGGSEMNQPSDVFSNGNQLFVGESRNRVLIWDSWPTSNQQAADRVIGHIDFNGNTTGLGNNALLDFPHKVYVYNNKLFVSEGNDHKVLIFEAP